MPIGCKAEKRKKIRKAVVYNHPNITIVIKAKSFMRFEEVMEKRVIPIKKRYPYAVINIEVEVNL